MGHPGAFGKYLQACHHPRGRRRPRTRAAAAPLRGERPQRTACGIQHDHAVCTGPAATAAWSGAARHDVQMTSPLEQAIPPANSEL